MVATAGVVTTLFVWLVTGMSGLTDALIPGLDATVSAGLVTIVVFAAARFIPRGQ